ncbi:MAG: Nitroreductase family protein [Candidatus Jettenia ecosi]|uniref:Nitroreductase family protein n=1 Tax=Candidatus Jettenia ecosi TaxID=2494326 RepID=A0A533Q8T8_9BACT|nr:MAG: Nitroreductase family protein [Candidatus Jettenia ecosi]
MDIYEIMKKRRSIRSYKPEPVEEEKMHRILETVRFAPSAANRQPVFCVVIKDEKIKQQLKMAYQEEWFYTAPVIICVCSVPEKSWKRSDGKNYADVDATIVMDHLILAATAEGLGTCWIAAFKAPLLKSILNLPAGVEPIAITPLGYPLNTPEPTYRKPLEEMIKCIY